MTTPIRLCYPYRPETKGKIENTVKYVRNNFWSGRIFESLSDINVQCLKWIQKVNSQIHGTTHQIPAERWKRESLNPPSSVPTHMTRNEEIGNLQTIPGIGLFSAVLIYSEICDITRFQDSTKLLSYARLVPSVRQ